VAAADHEPGLAGPDPAADLEVLAAGVHRPAWRSSPAGLVIYWTWSNILTIGQQYLIMRRYEVENPIDQLIAKLTGNTKEPAK
jgi:hypothetical protein